MFKSSVCVAAASALVASSAALADTVRVGDFIAFSDVPGRDFNANVLQTGHSFRTFCLEKTENIFFGAASFSASGGDPTRTHPFLVEAISERAIEGGPDFDEPDVPGDPISSRTAFLYQNFARGTLAGYSYGGDNDSARILSANALQNAIWFLEHEITDQYDGYADQATRDLIDFFLTMDMGGFSGIGDVRVLNLRFRFNGPGGQAGEHAQDVLVLIPLPHTGGLAFAGLMGVAALRRRR